MTAAGAAHRFLARAAAVVLVAAAAVTTLAAPAGAGTTSALRLAGQPITVAPDADFVIELQPALRADAVVTVTARALDAGAFRASLADTAGPSVDEVTLDASAVVPSRTSVRITVPTESTTDTAGRLQLPAAGPYAITIRATGVDAPFTTALVRTAGASPPLVRVALAVAVDSPLTLQPNGETSIDPNVRAEVTALAGMLERSIVPMTVSIRPELVRGLTRSGVPGDAELVTRLGAALRAHTLLAAPYVHLDPSAAAATGALPLVYASLLREGEDTLSSLLGQFPDRRVWIAVDPLTTAGGSLVRTLGANVVLRLGGAGIAPAQGGPSANDISITPDEAPVPLVLADPAASALDSGSNDPLLAASTLAVQLVATHPVGDGDGAVLMIDPAAVDSATFDAFVAVVARQAPLVATRIDETTGSRGVVAPDGPTTVVADLTGVASTRGDLVRLVETTKAMLPAGDDRSERWPELTDAVLDSRLSDSGRADYADELRATLTGIQNAVVVLAPSAVNLGDRSSTVPISIRNDNPFPVVVAVRLLSAKLKLPPTSEPTTIAPGTTALLRIRVDARTNGRFPVTAELVAPGTDQRVGQPVTFSVRVGRLTGLGIVVTFGALLILLTWWVQHLRRRTRKRRGAGALERHPVSGAAGGGG